MTEVNTHVSRDLEKFRFFFFFQIQNCLLFFVGLTITTTTIGGSKVQNEFSMWVNGYGSDGARSECHELVDVVCVYTVKV